MRSFVKFKPGQQGNRSNNRRYGEIRYEREMSTWRPFRYCGLMASFCAMLLGCVAAWSRHWVSGRGMCTPLYFVVVIIPSPVQAFQQLKNPLACSREALCVKMPWLTALSESRSLTWDVTVYSGHVDGSALSAVKAAAVRKVDKHVCPDCTRLMRPVCEADLNLLSTLVAA